MVALSLPQDENESGIREKVFDEIELSEHKKENGLDILIKFLDGKLGKDELADSLEKFEDFEDFSRGNGQSILDCINKFDQKYNRMVKVGMFSNGCSSQKLHVPPHYLAHYEL